MALSSSQAQNLEPTRAAKRRRTDDEIVTGLSNDLSTSHVHTPTHPRQHENNTFERSTIVPFGKDAKPEYLIVHRVTCTRARVDGEDHQDHNREADYLDNPRLVAGDTRGSPLRGSQPLFDLESYLDTHPEVLFYVIRSYDCCDYHAFMKDSFELAATGIERRVLNRVRPWIYQLSTPGPYANYFAERISISETLSTSLVDLVSRSQPFLGVWNSQTCLETPYDYFYHFRRRLQDFGLSLLGPHDVQELALLLDYINDAQGSVFDSIDKVFASGKVDRAIFGKLFAPNDLIVTTREGYPRAYFTRDIRTTYRDRKRDSPALALDCWTWDFDGSFRKKFEVITVAWPSSNPDNVLLHSLSAWPLRLDGEKVADRLRKRGRNLWNYRHRMLVSYNAPIPTIFELQITNPKYMIDYQTCRQMHPTKFTQPLAVDSEMKDQGVDMSQDEPPEEPFCILLPPTILGYAFHDKKWRNLSIEHVEPVPWNREAIDHVVLKASKKDTIKALVTVHLKAVQNVDVVENKGNGLIILLHGPPGTGKTLTAESVAEFARKPLYRVTCGEIGTDVVSVEKYMDSVLLIGTIWQCVVLLDEADVFLEERQVTDLARNALVSIFLRMLEYYEGILILTTNRIGFFDEAFKSRIQLSVHFPKLDEEGRYEIWINFLTVLKQKDVDMNFEELKRKVNVLARIPFNGRQIRNNLWTAAQVAKYKNEKLGFGHLEQVVEISQEFERYLAQTRGHTDEQNAKEQGLRGF